MHARGNYLALLLLCELALMLVASLPPIELVRRLFVVAALLLPTLLLRRAPAGTPRLRLVPQSPWAFLLLLLLPVFILAVLGTSLAWGALADLLGLTLEGAQPMSSLPLALLFDALLPAVCEEIFCRGAVFAVLRPLGRRVAIPVSALVFALMHANAAQIPYALVAGILLGALYEVSGTILLPILFHFASNATSLFMMNGLPAGATALVLGVLLAIGLLFLFLLRKRWPHIHREEPLPFGVAARELASPALLLWVVLILILTVL